MRKLFLILSLALLASPAFATTWYVATSGSGNCTTGQSIGTPLSTINAALACVGFSAGAGAGDIVQVANGTYTETISTWPSGTSGNVFTLKSATQYGAIIRPNGGTTIILFLNAPYVTVDGFVVDGVNVNANNIWLDADQITIQNIELKNTVSSAQCCTQSFQGIFNNGRVGGVIRNSLIHDIAATAQHFSSHGIYWGGSNGTIEGNTIHTISGCGMQIYSEGPLSKDNNIVRGNTIYNFGIYGSAAAIVTYGNNTQIYNNVVYQPTARTAYGISVAGSGTKIYNNTVVNTGMGVNTPSASGVSTVRNNILWQNAYTARAGDIASNNVTANPSFVSQAGGDFHLQVGSPAIGAGCATTACNTELTAVFTTDKDGNARGSIPPAWDAGAYEYQASGGDSMTLPTISSVGVGQSQTITWTCVGCGGGGIDIDLDRGNDGSFDTVIVDNTTNDGSHTWTVTGTANPTNVIRVRDSDASPTQTSNVFAITASPAGTITIVEPKSGDLFLSGQQGPVRWTSTGISGQVRIDLSRDGGATWELGTTTILYSDPDEIFTYNAPTSSNCQIRVVTTDGSNITGTSSGSFRIGGTRAGFLLLP